MVNSSEYARSMDLYAAVLRDGQMQDVTNLTEETGGYCGMHNLEVVDGNVTAGWLANDSGDLLFAEGQNHRYEAVYEQGAWKVQREDAGRGSERSRDAGAGADGPAGAGGRSGKR